MWFLEHVISLDTRCPKGHPFYVKSVKHAHNEQCFGEKLRIMRHIYSTHSTLFAHTTFPLNRNYIENCVLLAYYITDSGNSLLSIWDHLSAPFLSDSWPLKMGPIGFPETSVRNYHYLLCNSPEEHGYHLLRDGGQKSQKLLPPPRSR